jgi:hypothetical protein
VPVLPFTLHHVFVEYDRFGIRCTFDRCHIILITGQRSIFCGTTKGLHMAILKTCPDRTRVEFLEVVGVANVLEEKASMGEHFEHNSSCLPGYLVQGTAMPPVK